MRFSDIILIRHGETVSNSEGRFQGSQDSPLTERGRADAARLGAYFGERLGPVDYWYVSPYGRARDTSRLIREAMDDRPLPPEEVHRELREINCGTFETQLHKEVDQALLARIREEADCAYPGPGGESKVDVSRRARLFWDELRARARAERNGAHFRAIIVAHGNFNQCLGGVLLGVDPTLALRSIIVNTGICRFLTEDPDAPCRLLSWGETPHLDEWREF